MTNEYEERYAKYYDLLYNDKDYEKECGFVEEIFQKYSPEPVKTVLEAGSGSGSHAIPLAKKGYEITGFDISEAMIKRAKEKANGITNLEFHVMDLRNFQLNTKFDACISMFAVMGHLSENKDIQKTLMNIRGHLKEGSLFIFDVWNGLAVLNTKPSVRVKVVEDKDLKITRIAEPELDAFNHTCKVNYRLIVAEDKKIVDEVEEAYVVRYYFPQEIKLYMENAGFEVVKICPFLDLNGRVDENVWNIAVIARAGGVK